MFQLSHSRAAASLPLRRIGTFLQSSGKQQSLLIAVITTALSLIPTIYAAYSSNSIVLFSDLLRCVVEFFAILLSWLIVRYVSRGDLALYNYGFGKFEQLASLAVAVAMFVSFFLVIFSAVSRFISPLPLERIGFGLLLALLSIGGNFILWQHNRKLSLSQTSPVLESQAQLFRMKTLAAMVVSASLLVGSLAPYFSLLVYADPVGSVVLAGFLLYSAIGLFSSSVYDLLDHSLEEGLRLLILKALISHEKLYQNFIFVRSRRASSKIYIEIGLGFGGDLQFSEVHQRIQIIQKDVARLVKGSEVNVVPILKDQG